VQATGAAWPGRALAPSPHPTVFESSRGPCYAGPVPPLFTWAPAAVGARCAQRSLRSALLALGALPVLGAPQSSLVHTSSAWPHPHPCPWVVFDEGVRTDQGPSASKVCAPTKVRARARCALRPRSELDQGVRSDQGPSSTKVCAPTEVRARPRCALRPRSERDQGPSATKVRARPRVVNLTHMGRNQDWPSTEPSERPQGQWNWIKRPVQAPARARRGGRGGGARCARPSLRSLRSLRSALGRSWAPLESSPPPLAPGRTRARATGRLGPGAWATPLAVHAPSCPHPHPWPCTRTPARALVPRSPSPPPRSLRVTRVRMHLRLA